MDIDKRNKIVVDCEEAIDEILHQAGYVFDHEKIRDKIRELLDENLTKHNNDFKKVCRSDLCMKHSRILDSDGYCLECNDYPNGKPISKS